MPGGAGGASEPPKPGTSGAITSRLSASASANSSKSRPERGDIGRQTTGGALGPLVNGSVMVR
jgi:hypothetical protein